MEEPKIVQLAELLQRSRPLSAAASIRNVPGISDPSSSLNFMSKKRKFHSSERTRLSDIDNEVDDSEEIPTSKIIYAHRNPAVLVGTVRLAYSSSSNSGCCDKDCLTFSDSAARVCCSVIRLDFKILGRLIRVHAWNFIPLKCSGGVLEIIRWDLVNPTGEVDFRTSPLLPLDYVCSGRGEPAVYGKMVAVSPTVTVSSVIRSRKNRTRAEHGISDNRNLKGFLADVMACDCASCNSGAFLERSDHSCTKPVILFFCGSTSSWRPVISSLLGCVVCVRDVKKKLISTRGEKYEMFVTKERAALYPCQLPAETISIRQIKISGKGEIDVYKGTVTGIYMQGMVLELDKKVWLLLTNHSPVAPHFLRIGSIISLSNIHFVYTTFPWGKVLLLGSCIKTNLHVNSFSPVEAQCIYRPLKWSSLGKFIESLTFSAKFWKKFAGTLSEREILGSNHEEGFVQMYCRCCLPACAFQTQCQTFIEFCEHDCYNCGKEMDTGNLKLVLPFNNFIDNCQVIWINLLSQMKNETEITDIATHVTAQYSVDKPHGRLTRQFISSKDLQVILMGTLQISPSSGRLQMVDATGTIDVVVPDLLSNSDLNKIYEVKDYVLILEGLPVPLDSIGSLENYVFSCRSIFNPVKSKKRKFEQTFYVLFYLRNATCLRMAFNFPHKDRHVSFNRSEGSKFKLLMVTHKFPSVRSCQDGHNGLRPSFFAEAEILPFYLVLHGDCRDSLLPATEQLTGDLTYAEGKDGGDKRLKGFQASEEIWRLTSCKHKLLQMHSTSQFPCSLAVRADNNVQLLACLICHGDSDTKSEQKVLLQFNHEMFSQYELLRFGALYIMQYEKEEVLQNFTCRKSLVTSQNPIWSLSLSSENVLHQHGLQKSHFLEASSLNNGRERLINLQMNELSSDVSTSDIHLYIPSEAADLLSGCNNSREYGLSRTVVATEHVLSVSACVNMMAIASQHVSVLGSPDCRLPHGDLISLNGNIVDIHNVLEPSASCVHVCDGDHMVMIQSNSDSNSYPVGMGPGMNATFYRVLMTGEEHKLMLTSASLVIINSIKEVDIHYFARKCSAPVCNREDLRRKSINTVPCCLIRHLYQGTEKQPIHFRCRVVSVHTLVVEHTDKIENTYLQSSKMPAIRISLAGFILDDGSSSCSCWAYADNASALLRLNDTLSKVFNDSSCSLNWASSDKTLKTIGNRLEKMLNMHGRVTVKKFGKLLDLKSLNFVFSVDSSNELTPRDENFLKSIILKASCGPVLNVMGSEMDSDTIEQLKQVTEIAPSLRSFKNIWAIEVRHMNPAQEARALIQELMDTQQKPQVSACCP